MCSFICRRSVQVLLAAGVGVSATTASAGYGAFLHGYGIQSGGAGGVGFSLAQDSYPLAANPALAGILGKRFDVGLIIEVVDPQVRISGNSAGADQTYRSKDKVFPIPQGGIVIPISTTLAAGFTGFAAGTGARYEPSPLERFGGPEKASLALGQIGISSVLAYSPAAQHWLGLGVNVGYQSLEVKGAQPFSALSESPEHVSNQGVEPSIGVGFTLGYYGRWLQWLEAGFSYRSKTWTQRAEEYEGLLPEQGRLELPAIYGLGFTATLNPAWRLSIEMQRVLYGKEKATGNRLGKLFDEGQLLGSEDGPGFGWRNQNIYKLGVIWQASPTLTLRGGYSRANNQMRNSETLFAMFSPSENEQHASLGATYKLDPQWEVSAYLTRAFSTEVKGRNSIPDALGGGEADIKVSAWSIGLSFARSF